MPPHLDVAQLRGERSDDLVGMQPIRLPTQPGQGSALRQPRPDPRDAERCPRHRAEREQEHVGAAAGPVVQGDLAAGPGDTHGLGREVEGVVDVAVLQRDVAERHVRRVRRQVQGLSVGDVDRAEPVDLAEPSDGLVGALQEPGIEVARHDRSVLAGERTGHPTDAAPDLDDRLLVDVRCPEPEDREVRRHFRVTGRHELRERELGAGLVVEHPARRPHDIVAAHLTLAQLARGSPRDQLWSPHHAP